MTKTVRIENADTSDFKVEVTVQEKDISGEWMTIDIINLDFPTAMTNNIYLTSTRRIIIEESGVSDMQFYDKKYVKGLEQKVYNAA